MEKTLVYGKYRLIQQLAQGGLGEVWKARSYGVEGFEKVLVIKRIARSLSEDARFVEPFIDEAKVSVMLTHANIAQVFDLGLVDGTYFIAMEYVRGPDLGRVLRRARLPQELAIFIISELAKALDYAHRRRNAELSPLGIVHRGVSAENVLLSDEGEVKLTDFGMARARESVPELSELPELKYAYLAPEQIRDEDLDARADIYALGVLLFEALCGERVLAHESARQTFERTRDGRALSLDRLGPDVSNALRAVVQRAIAVRREERYANAGELYEELIALLYESGRRVNALDLSRWLEQIAEPDPEAFVEAVTLPRDLEEIFAEHTVSVLPPAPVAAPRGHDDAASLPLVEGELASLPPRSEWREVSVLLVSADGPLELASFAARFGGELLLDQGSASLVVFGLAEASGRDAHAAARCALRLARVHGRERLSLAVHSGRLLLDSEGKPSHAPSREALHGEALHWLGQAGRGEFVATPAAASLLEARFELSSEQPSGVRTIGRELRPDEGVGKLIGRREELRAIGEVFAIANRAELRVLGIQGEAGSGKSRLIVELERRLRHAGHDVGIYVAACSPQGRAIPFFALQELVRAVLGVDDLESPTRLGEQIDRLRLLGLASEQRDAVARLLGVNIDSAQPSSHTVKLEQALVRVAYKLAKDRLTVFVFDNAEFMDAASLELTLRLVALPYATRVVVIFASRPPATGPWTKLPNFDAVPLGPLADEEVARLVRHRLGASEVQGDLVREVILKTGGNPLFVEELLVAMREHGSLQVEHGVAQLVVASAQVELPRTLRGLVASRVGKLPATHRLILQLAVTFGSRFAPELLAHAAGLDEDTVQEALSLLAQRDIVRAVSPSEHSFAHELVRDVLYSAIPLDQRPALHAAVAGAIETLSPPQLEALIERLAYHYREAGQWLRAVHFLTRAGARYEAEHALDPAIEAYSQIIELLMRDPECDRTRVLALHARIGELALHTRTSELMADRMGSAIQLAESWGAEGYQARFAMLRGRLLNKASRFREGRLWLERAQLIARKLGDRTIERDVALAAAEAHARNGEYTAVAAYVASAIEAARATHDVRTEILGLLLIVPAYTAIGELASARQALEKLDLLVGDDVARSVQIELQWVRALVFEAEGDLPAACDVARKGLDLAKQYGLSYEIAVYAHHLGALHIRADEEPRAFAALRLSYDVSTEHGFLRWQWRSVCLLGFLDALRFDSEQGYTRMQQAVQYAEERGYVLDLIDEKYLLAMVEQKRERLERAAALLREVIELADSHGHIRACRSAEAAQRALAASSPIAMPSGGAGGVDT